MTIRTRCTCPCACLLIALLAFGWSSRQPPRAADTSAERAAPQFTAQNAFGFARTININGEAVIDPANPFFQSLGTNGRACISCHVPNQAWTISPPDVQRRFALSDGTDAIFRTND